MPDLSTSSLVGVPSRAPSSRPLAFVSIARSVQRLATFVHFFVHLSYCFFISTRIDPPNSIRQSSLHSRKVSSQSPSANDAKGASTSNARKNRNTCMSLHRAKGMDVALTEGMGLLFRLVCLGALVGVAEGTQPPEVPLQNGDVVLQASTSDRSALIRRASRSPYSHVGLVEVARDGVFVLEAVQPVSRTPLAAWVKRGEGGWVTVLRPKGLDAPTRGAGW